MASNSVSSVHRQPAMDLLLEQQDSCPEKGQDDKGEDEPDTPVKGNKRQLSKDTSHVQRVNLMAKIEGDFLELSKRECSTSTPFTARRKSLDSVELQIISPSNDSVENDSGMASKCSSGDVSSSDIFLHPSVLTDWKPKSSHSQSSTKRRSIGSISRYPADCYDVVCGSYESDLSSLPLPKILLLPQFEETELQADAKSQDGDSAFEDLSFTSSSCSLPDGDLSQNSDYLEFDVPSSSSSLDLDFKPSLPDEASFIAFEQILKQYSPPQLDRLIGRKMGCGQLDIISELHARGLVLVLENIFSMLSDKDLCSMTAVNSSWGAIMKDCKNADRRKSCYSEALSINHQEEKVNTHT